MRSSIMVHIALLILLGVTLLAPFLRAAARNIILFALSIVRLVRQHTLALNEIIEDFVNSLRQPNFLLILMSPKLLKLEDSFSALSFFSV